MATPVFIDWIEIPSVQSPMASWLTSTFGNRSTSNPPTIAVVQSPSPDLERGASPSGEDPEPVDRGVEATIPIGQGFAQDPEWFGDTHHESAVISAQPPFSLVIKRHRKKVHICIFDFQNSIGNWFRSDCSSNIEKSRLKQIVNALNM